MLNTSVNRRPVSPLSRALVATASVALAIAVAGAAAVAQSSDAAVSGAFVDALNNAIPNVTLTITNAQTGEKYTVRSDDAGRFTFDALPDGEYRGETSAPGFRDTHPYFRVSRGQSSINAAAADQKVIPLGLGSVEETITVTDNHGSSGRSEQALALDRLVQFRQKAQTLPLAPPIKIRDVRPVFPPAGAGSDGTVFLEGVIDTNGYVKGLQVMQPSDAEFGRAAQDAINDWQFEPTRLHGVPVDTPIHVTVRFLR